MMRPTRADAGGRADLDLQQLARSQGRPIQTLLVIYVLERYLARVASCPDADRFVLTGGMLLAAWNSRRATVDGDLLAHDLTLNRDDTVQRIVAIVSSPAPVEDGVEFLADTTTGRTIRNGDLYQGVRVTMDTRVGRAQVKLQRDISTGDPVTPAPERITYPTLRQPHTPLNILGYPLPVVLAEKICTAVDLGQRNTRVRGYADMWTLTRRHPIDGTHLRDELKATASHRGVILRPLADLIEGFSKARAAA